MVKFSIIIPHYNSYETLLKLLSTIPQSEYIEILVIDDNSNYEVREKLEKISRIKLFFNNTGIQSAGVCRNIGIEKSKGEWLIFADADDYFENEFITVIESKVKNIDKDIDIVFFIPNSINIYTNKPSKRGNRQRKLVYDYLLNKNKYNEDRLRYYYQTPWSKLHRRSSIINNNIMFDETIVSNDVMFAFYSGKMARKIMAVNEKIYCITENGRGLTKVGDIKKEIVRAQVLINFYQAMNEYERKITRISYLPFLFRIRKYNFSEILNILKIFKKNDMPIIKYIIFGKILSLTGINIGKENAK